MNSCRIWLDQLHTHAIVLLVTMTAGVVLTQASVAGAAGQAASDIFSIHVASFKELKNANAFVNSLQSQGKIVFWKEMEVENKGYFYRIFTGRYQSYQAAEKDWQLLKSQGRVTYKGIFRFKDLLPKPEARQDQVKTKAPPPVDPGKTKAQVVVKSRFVDNHDGTVTDRQNGLMWVQNGWHLDFFSALSWAAAVGKLRKFKAGGYADWSLPTKVEWESLMDGSIQAPAIAEPNPFKNIIIHMPYWAQDGPPRLLSRRYTALMYSGTINHQQKDDVAFIMPVRKID